MFCELLVTKLPAQPLPTLASWRDREDVRSGSKVVGTRKANILLIGESPYLFSLCRSSLEKTGCQCHFAESRQEIGKLLRHTELDIALTLNAQHGLSEIVALLAGSRVSMFHRVPVEEGCWWLPVLRNGHNCLGAAAFRPNEFSCVFAEIVKSIITDATLNPLSTT